MMMKLKRVYYSIFCRNIYFFEGKECHLVLHRVKIWNEHIIIGMFVGWRVYLFDILIFLEAYTHLNFLLIFNQFPHNRD